MNTLSIKVSKIYRVDTGSALKAFADIVINEAVLIRGIRVVEGKHGMFVSMPKEKSKDNRWFDRIRFLDQDADRSLAEEVLKAYGDEAASGVN